MAGVQDVCTLICFIGIHLEHKVRLFNLCSLGACCSSLARPRFGAANEGMSDRLSSGHVLTLALLTHVQLGISLKWSRIGP